MSREVFEKWHRDEFGLSYSKDDEISKAALAGWQACEQQEGSKANLCAEILILREQKKKLEETLECGGRLIAESDEWESATGLPTFGSLHIFCEYETSIKDLNHNGYFSEWQPVINTVETWANCVKN